MLIILGVAAQTGAVAGQVAAAPADLPYQPGGETTEAGSATKPRNETDNACVGIVPTAAPKGIHRNVEVDDIIRLRDFGKMDASEGDPAGFSVSPDGRLLAIQIRQADPFANAYCQALLLYDLSDNSAPPHVLDTGGDYVRRSISLYGLEGFPTGTPEPLTPKWSKDGERLAFLKRENGVTRLFVATTSSRHIQAVSDEVADVFEFEWSSTVPQLRYRQRSNLIAARHKLRTEGRSGYQFDNRFWPLAELQPYPRGTTSEADRFVSFDEAAVGRRSKPPHQIKNANSRVGEPETSDPVAAIRGDGRITAGIDGAEIVCRHSECGRVAAAWRRPQSEDIFFIRREGFADSRTAIYRWNIHNDELAKIHVTDDALRGCDLQTHLICARESSLRPRDIVEIDLTSGAIHKLIDLNPEWAALKRGRVTRLRWTNKYGIEAYGDLVLPPDAGPDNSLPLVVVQYSSRGFLRGGTGDEYPIQAIAAQGFAVLSFNRPLDYSIAMARAGRSISKRQTALHWTDRANVHDSLMRGIRLAAKTNPIDPAYLAITGLSDGASTATYALIHSNTFSLALLSSCCEDPDILETAVGAAYMSVLRENQHPLPWEQHRASWKRVSLAMNADRVCAKIVIQAADREARLATASLRALKEHGRDVTMFIFPDEYHVKWQPAHREAVYMRALNELKAWRQSRPITCP